jgi:hypothetical protein
MPVGYAFGIATNAALDAGLLNDGVRVGTCLSFTL